MNAFLPLNIGSARACTTASRGANGLAHVTAAQDFRKWLADEGDNLIAAVQLLGGPRWAKRAAGIVASARSGGSLSARDNTLTAVRDLLHGSHAGSIDGLDPFAWLHPDDPRALNAMRCADALDYGLSALAALRRTEHATGLNEDGSRMG